MGIEYAVVLEARDDAVVTDAEIEAYYEAHCPRGVPPLSEIREHIHHAIVAARPVEPEPLYQLTRHVDGRATNWVAFDIDLLAAEHGWPPLHSFVVRHPQKYFDAAEGLALFEPLVERVQAELAGDVATRKPRGKGDRLPIKKHAGAWESALTELIAYRDLLRQAAEYGRRFRVEIFV